MGAIFSIAVFNQRLHKAGALTFCALLADNECMDWEIVLETVKSVITDQRVYGTAIVVFLFVNFGVFVANYVKKTPAPKVKHAKPAPKTAAAPAQGDKGSEGEKAPAAEDASAEKAKT